MAKKARPVSKHQSLFVPLSTVALVISLSLFAYFKWATRQAVAPTSSAPTQSGEVQVVAPISLPRPVLKSSISLEAVLYARRSRRDFTDSQLTLKQVGQLLWAAQGITTDWGGRTTPSAKSAYPLTLYLAAYNVEKLDPGLYRYFPGDLEPTHQLILEKPGDLKQTLGEAIGQAVAKEPPAIIIFTGDMEKMAKAFDNQRMDNNVYLEVGHAAENLYLQAESLGLGTVSVAGFNADKVREVTGIPASLTIIYAMPIGVPKK